MRWPAFSAEESRPEHGGAFFVNDQGLATIDLSEGKLVDRRLDSEEDFLSSGFAVWENRLYVLGSRAVYALECPGHRR